MNKFLPLLLLSTACSVDISTPAERGIKLKDCDYNQDPKCNPYENGIHKIYNQDKAMLLTESMVEDHYKVVLDDLFAHTTVYWTETQCPYQDGIAVVYEGKCYYGRMWSCDEMYVSTSNKNPERTCGSALIHEFGHCILQEMYGDWNADAVHQDEEFWSVIQEAAKTSCIREW